jgi:hypothetical protein
LPCFPLSQANRFVTVMAAHTLPVDLRLENNQKFPVDFCFSDMSKIVQNCTKYNLFYFKLTHSTVYVLPSVTVSVSLLGFRILFLFDCLLSLCIWIFG